MSFRLVLQNLHGLHFQDFKQELFLQSS